MTSMKIWKLVTAAALASLMACNSTDSGDNGNGKQASGDVATDLQTLANSITRMPTQEQPELPGTTSAALLKVSDDLWDAEKCSIVEGQEHITVCASAIGDYYSIDTTSSFEADGTTPSSTAADEWTANGVSLTKSHYKDDLYVSEFSTRTVSSMNVDVTTGSYSFNFSITGSGSVNYYLDDVVLDIPAVSLTMNESGYQISYELSLLDGAYTTVLKDSGTLGEASGAQAGSIDGDLLDKSGTKVGTFRLMADETVQILDAEGNVIQAADGANAEVAKAE